MAPAHTPAPGSDGTYSHGGYLLEQGEKNAKLRGANQWVTYDNIVANVTIVAAAVGVWLDLAGSSKWAAIPNPKGGRDAKLAAELVQEGFLDARMETKWRGVVKRQAVKRFRGFAMHAMGWRRSADGRIVLAELAHRPQWSIERWMKPSETGPLTGVVQRTRSGAEFPIDRGDLFYSREGALGDDPRGVGLFRHLAEVADIFSRARQVQMIGFDVDVNGVPVGRAPLSQLEQAARDAGVGATAATEDERAAAIRAYVLAQCVPIRDFCENRVVGPKRSLLLDSLPFFSTETDGSSRPIAGTFQWSVEILKQNIGSLPELGSAIRGLTWEMAVVLSAEFLLVGGEGSSGAYAASADKTNLFATRVNSSLDDVGDDAERDIVPDLLARNGLTDERLMPSLQHEPVSRTAAKTAAESLRALAAAKLKPGDPAENVLRARMELPPAEYDEEDIEAWRAARRGPRRTPEVRTDEQPAEDPAPSGDSPPEEDSEA